jgi:uncharacterized protein (TIGR02453 family)
MIKKETFSFLADLIEQNDRDWFQENKDRYLAAKENVDAFADSILNQFRKIDTSIPPELTSKKCVMRIYRDVRFSKDKSPYKNNFGIGISSRGKGNDGPGYYIHIQPGHSFVAGGYWMPQAEHLKAIRQEIDYNTADFLNIIEEKKFKSYFSELDQNEKLKTSPKGYEVDHPYIELLKLKSFTVTHSFTDTALTDAKSVENVIEGLQLIYPFSIFLNQAILS